MVIQVEAAIRINVATDKAAVKRATAGLLHCTQNHFSKVVKKLEPLFIQSNVCSPSSFESSL
jgi:hypothetical protein